MDMEIFEKIRGIVAEQFGVDPDEITPITSFEDNLSADSLDVVELTMSLEEEFDLGELEDEALENLRTVGDVVNLIASKQ